MRADSREGPVKTRVVARARSGPSVDVDASAASAVAIRASERCERRMVPVLHVARYSRVGRPRRVRLDVESVWDMVHREQSPDRPRKSPLPRSEATPIYVPRQARERSRPDGRHGVDATVFARRRASRDRPRGESGPRRRGARDSPANDDLADAPKGTTTGRNGARVGAARGVARPPTRQGIPGEQPISRRWVAGRVLRTSEDQGQAGNRTAPRSWEAGLSPRGGTCRLAFATRIGTSPTRPTRPQGRSGLTQRRGVALPDVRGASSAVDGMVRRVEGPEARPE